MVCRGSELRLGTLHLLPLKHVLQLSLILIVLQTSSTIICWPTSSMHSHDGHVIQILSFSCGSSADVTHRYDAERQNSKMQVDRRKRSSGSPMRKSGKIASAASSPLSSQTDASASASASGQSLKATKKEAKQSKKSIPSLKEMSEKSNSAAKAEKERKAREAEWKKTMGPAMALLVSARRIVLN